MSKKCDVCIKDYTNTRVLTRILDKIYMNVCEDCNLKTCGLTAQQLAELIQVKSN